MVIKFFRGFNINISAPMFDGIMPYGYNDTRFLEIITEEVAKKFPMLDIYGLTNHTMTLLLSLTIL